MFSFEAYYLLALCDGRPQLLAEGFLLLGGLKHAGKHALNTRLVNLTKKGFYQIFLRIMLN